MTLVSYQRLLCGDCRAKRHDLKLSSLTKKNMTSTVAKRLNPSGDSEIDQLILELSEGSNKDKTQLEDSSNQCPRNRTTQKRSRRTKRRKGKNAWDIRFDRRTIAELLDDLYGYTSDWDYFTEGAAYRASKATTNEGVVKNTVIKEEKKVEEKVVEEEEEEEEGHYGISMCMSF